MTLGQKIRELRKLKGLSMQEVGDALSVSKQAVSKYELDKYVPDWDTLQKMAVFLDGDINELKPLWLTKDDINLAETNDIRAVKEALGDVSSKLYIEQEKNKALREEIKKLRNLLADSQDIKGTGTE